MKKIVVCFPILLMVLSLSAQTKKYDTLAILIIDRMADVIGDLESCSFKLNTASDMTDPSNGLVKYFSDYEVYMDGPDKMVIQCAWSQRSPAADV